MEQWAWIYVATRFDQDTFFSQLSSSIMIGIFVFIHLDCWVRSIRIWLCGITVLWTGNLPLIIKYYVYSTLNCVEDVMWTCLIVLNIFSFAKGCSKLTIITWIILLWRNVLLGHGRGAATFFACDTPISFTNETIFVYIPQSKLYKARTV